MPSIAPQYELESHTQAQKPPKQFLNMKLKVKQEFLNIGLSTPMEKGMKNAIMEKKMLIHFDEHCGDIEIFMIKSFYAYCFFIIMIRIPLAKKL